MVNIKEFENAFCALPVEDKIQVLDKLEWNLRKELHERALREDMAIVEKRFADLDAGITKAIPWEEVRRDLFRDS